MCGNDEVIVKGLEVLYTISKNNREGLIIVTKLQIIPKLIQNLTHSNLDIVLNSIKVIGNLTTMDDIYTCSLMKDDILTKI